MLEHKNLSEVKLFCQKLLNQFVEKNWCNNIDDFQLSKLSGGLTNTLYVCGRTHSDCADDNKYVVRFFGSGKVNNIHEENIIASVVGSMKLGPEILGIFEGGRIEEFIPSHTITTPELAGINKTVANMTARLHKLNMPIDKSGEFLKNTMDIYFKKIHLEKLEPDFRRKLTDAYEMTLTILSNTNSPVCFCHNDTQPGNTLKPLNSPTKSPTKTDSEPLLFIDYEYSAYNNRAFDAGNFFAEWIYNYEHTKEVGGYSANLDNYPSVESQKEYARAYFEVIKGNDTVEDGEVLKFIEEARQFTLVSHCFWSIWCLINDNSDAFDYMHYANCRLDHFFKQSDIFNELKEK